MTGAAPLEVQRLRDRVAELEAALGQTECFPVALLPRAVIGRNSRVLCSKVLGLLLARKVVPACAAYAVIYGARPECDQPQSENVIRVAVSALRKALAPYGVTITHEHGAGYTMPDRAKRIVRAVMADARRAAA